MVTRTPVARSRTSTRILGAKLPIVWSPAWGILASWIAAGSTGFLVQPLQISLTWLALGLSILAARPRFAPVSLLCVAVTTILLFFSEPTSLHMSLVVLCVLSMLAAGTQGVERRVLWITAISSLALVMFRFAQQTMPTAWLVSDWFGGGIGSLVATASSRPLRIGATFAGLDFLLVMGVFWGGWLAAIQTPRRFAACCAAVAIVTGHCLYLAALVYLPGLSHLLPEGVAPIVSDPYIPPPWSWPATFRQMLPWNLPFLAAAIQMAILVAMLRWSNWRPATARSTRWELSRVRPTRPFRGVIIVAACLLAPFLLALLMPMVGTLQLAQSNLTGKRIVVHQDDRLDWRVPSHGSYGQASAGTYGMLPMLIQSLGGHAEVTKELLAPELNSADVLVLLSPGPTMTEDQTSRIQQYVRAGGSLLLIGEGYQPGDAIPFAQLLRPTAMSLEPGGAVPIVEGWQNAHWSPGPLVASPNQTQATRFLSNDGASVRLSWPARPLLIGRWAWCAPEAGIAQDSRRHLAEDEKLGDLVLAGEQSLGQGTIVVLGDPLCMTNEGLVDGYAFAGRLLSRLANRGSNPHAAWRQLFVLLAAAGMFLLVLVTGNAERLAIVSALLAVALLACSDATTNATRVVPDGKLLTSDSDNGPISRLAYIDSSHLESFSREPWGYDGINGLALNLVRNGYLALTLPRITSERLERAALVVSIAPSRGFSQKECDQLREFVWHGGVLISTVGAERSAASARLISTFNLNVPSSPVPTFGDWPEPEPMGRFRTLFFDGRVYSVGDYRAGVTFHAGWPITMHDAKSEILVYGRLELPIVANHAVGAGKFVLIGDSGFALNKNLEYIGGETFGGKKENADFWRWLISRVASQEEWIPPPPVEDEPLELTDE